MTDITELAQSLKRRAASANEFGESLYVKADDILALVEALEKAQQQNISDFEIKARLCKESNSLHDRLREAEKRIAELESRTVKLPPKIERDDTDGWFMYNGGRVGGCAAEWYNKALDDVGAELTAAGIKVEAE